MVIFAFRPAIGLSPVGLGVTIALVWSGTINVVYGLRNLDVGENNNKV
jgi:hypothetical protein